MSENENNRAESLRAEERQCLAAIRSAGSLNALAAIVGSDTEHEAYLEAKEMWRTLRAKELGEPKRPSGIPGDTVKIDGQPFVVHGITHRDTEPERSFLHEHVSEWLEAGETVYCEQGIRPMYFEAFPDVYEMDDYRWAMYHCRNEDVESHIDEIIEETFEEGLNADITEVAARFRKVVFSAIESGSEIYGDRATNALGDLASDFFMSHEDAATMDDFTSFRLSREAAMNPEALIELQQYYKRVLLPQPLEREWLRRHDRELELFTHARNERMADYVRFHAPETGAVHVIVGAAHLPGVTYYLKEIRDGERSRDEFESIP